jgi:glycolate oxidase FAD binding subunit
MNTSCLIDDFGPVPVHQPRSVAELGELVRTAAVQSQAIYPLGGQTMLDYGVPPTRPGIGVDLRQLDQVIDYPARDMTITVQAGITLARLQEILRGEGQRLPIDVPRPELATLGGAVACNVSGPRRYGFGTLRDFVIGISVVNDRGEEVKAGGRVVKNVAGYDLCKLYTGSLGTLGIITQLTLKVRPMPEESVLIDLHCPTENLARLLSLLHTSRTRPAGICVVSPPVASKTVYNWQEVTSAANDGWLVFVGFEDNRAAVNWQVKQLQQEVGSLGIPLWRKWTENLSLLFPPDEEEDAGGIATTHPTPDHAANKIWAALTDFPLTATSSVTFKANLFPGAVTLFCQRAEPLAPLLLAHAGNGIVIGHLPPDVSREQAKDTIQRLREQAVAAQGNLVLLRCPTAWKAELGVWGQPRGDWALMRAVKEQLDPQRLFNPGRFVGGV